MAAVSGPAAQPTASRDEIWLAGGCFWGVEEILRAQQGVLDTEVGYAGGFTEAPTYEQVKRGDTGHAEAVRVVFDPGTLSLDALLDLYFRLHDPTTRNRQGGDIGTQYRSAIFFRSPAQKEAAEKAKARAASRWKKPITTEIEPARAFTRAEEYHQEYLRKNPGGYTCHYLRPE